MVCDKCLKKKQEKGQGQGSIVPDRWKDGAANHGKVSATDKRVTAKEINNPYSKGKMRSCKICKIETIPEGHYCGTCAFKKGICSMCGKKLVNTSTEYRSTNA